MTKTTPGPWEFLGNEQGIVRDKKRGTVICFHHGDKGWVEEYEERVWNEGNPEINQEEVKANDHLIAAAPDLLRAAYAMILAGNHPGEQFDAKNLLHDAVAKAKGEK